MKKDKKKNTFILEILAIIFLIIGVVIYFMPSFSNWLYNFEVKNIKEEYVEQIEEISDFQRLYNELKSRNESLYINKQKELKDPFSYEQPSINLQEYGLKDNIIGFIFIPKMNLEIPIYLGANTENMKKGAVHLTQTSYPIGGENTNCVIAAHRGYGKAEMFRNIQKLEIGDDIYIQNFIEELVYKVSSIKIIDPTDIDNLLIQEGKDLITLITCHPYRYNYQRYVVYCERND